MHGYVFSKVFSGWVITFFKPNEIQWFPGPLGIADFQCLKGTPRKLERDFHNDME